MPSHHRFHPIELQTVAFFISLIPALLLFGMMTLGRYWESLRRARKPAMRPLVHEPMRLPTLVPIPAE